MGLENKPDIPLDGQGELMPTDAWSPFKCEKLITFIGATSNAWGDKDGTLKNGAIFNITGTVRLRILGVVETSLVGAGKVEVGVTGHTAKALAQVQNTTTMDEGQTWHDADVDSPIEASTVMDEIIVANSLDLLLTQSVADITAGAIRFLVVWYP